jgi:hypothetical protein
MPAKSEAQRKLMAMVHNCQKEGADACASAQVKKLAKQMTSEQTHDFMKKRKKKKKVTRKDA